jgi:hypothetical protein
MDVEFEKITAGNVKTKNGEGREDRGSKEPGGEGKSDQTSVI